MNTVAVVGLGQIGSGLATRLLERLPFYPLSSDQLTMLQEESVADPTRFFSDSGLQPEPLPVGLRRMFAPA